MKDENGDEDGNMMKGILMMVVYDDCYIKNSEEKT